MPIDSSVDYKHPIRVVARRTGLSPDVIRAYELAAVSRMDAGQQAHCLIYPADDLGLEAELRSLRSLLPAGVTLIIGGQAADSYAEVSVISAPSTATNRNGRSRRSHAG